MNWMTFGLGTAVVANAPPATPVATAAVIPPNKPPETPKAQARET